MANIFLLLLAFSLCPSHSMILDFRQDGGFKLGSGQTLQWGTAMFSREDSPLNPIEHPFVEVTAIFSRKKPSVAGSFEILIYESSYSNTLGYLASPDSKVVDYCCTQDLYREDKCDNREVGEVVRRPEKNIQRFRVNLMNLSVAVSLSVPVNLTGIYILLISNCRENGLGELTINGVAVWKNPYGYLPGDAVMLLPVTGVIALFQLLLFIGYSYLVVKYRKILMKIQYGILGVVGYSILEISAWYFYRLGTNNSGLYSVKALLVVVFLSNIRKTVVRVLVLLISMGVGIVKWTVGTTKVKIGFFALFYMFFSFLFQNIKEIEMLEKRSVVGEWLKLAILLPVAALETSFYFWIIMSLIRTIQQLTLRRQALKLQMYKAFFASLVTVGLLVAIFVLYTGYIKFSDTTLPWQNEWINEGFWEVLFFGILATISVLWRPRMNNSRYGYAEFFTDEENDDKSIALQPISIKGGDVKRRRKKEGDDEHDINQEEKVGNQETYDNSRESTIKMTKFAVNDDFDHNILSIELPSDNEEEITVETQIKKME